jgi:protein TonB
MEFRSNIIFSIFAHAMIFTAVLVVAGRDAVLRAPERFIAVTLFEHSAVPKNSPGPPEKKERQDRGKSNKPARILREVQPPAVSLPAKRPDKEPPAAPEKKNPGRKDAAPAQSPVASEKATDPLPQAGGATETSPGGMELAVPGNSPAVESAGGGKSGPAEGALHEVGAIRAAIERAKSYPLLARKRGLEGTVTAEFTISDKGFPENIRIVRSSGYAILDNAARKTLLRASPFPPLRGRLEVPITFRIDR